jgi:hypothetical protein
MALEEAECNKWSASASLAKAAGSGMIIGGTDVLIENDA